MSTFLPKNKNLGLKFGSIFLSLKMKCKLYVKSVKNSYLKLFRIILNYLEVEKNID